MTNRDADLQRQASDLAALNEQLIRRNAERAAISRALAAISNTPTLADVLQNVVDAARELIQSRYAALGVADEGGHLLEFITSGITPEERNAIGPTPQGHGLLGVLTREALPLRIPSVADDPRSTGFPPHHPPMKSLLGVPIVFKGGVVGDLYLADKIGADAFSEEDQQFLTLFASRAAIAIENARLYEAVRVTRDELEARNRELEKQYEYAEDTNRIKSEFLANMSHELRTPLNAIIGFAELMHDGRAGPVSPAHKEYLEDITTGSRHLLQLINDILDLSKVESGKMEFRPEPVDLALLAEEVRNILRTLAADKMIRVETEISPSLSDVVADPGRLKQILFNYLSNAIKFTPPGGRVELDIRSEAWDTYRVEVCDTGVGITAADLEKLFTDFQQLHAGRHRSQGTGLGLALTKRIVEAQGGRVGVESTPGQGSVFFAILPRKPLQALEVDDFEPD